MYTPCTGAEQVLSGWPNQSLQRWGAPASVCFGSKSQSCFGGLIPRAEVSASAIPY